MIPFPIAISNFRSIENEIEFPFNRKITFLAGQNNVGKSNVLRALAIVANKSRAHLDEPGASSQLTFTVSLSRVALEQKLKTLRQAAGSLMASNTDQGVSIEYRMHAGGIDVLFDESEFLGAFPSYFETDRFLKDFSSSSSSRRDNINSFINRLNVLDDLKGSTYVPHLRFIARQNEEPPHFLGSPFPGETIAFGSVIGLLAQMDRPAPHQVQLRDQLSQIQRFMAVCLEKSSVTIQVAHDRSAILLNIDGEERSLGNLGTGVEHLLMIGIASMGFKDRLVLIDEPELHLHPRAQRRMLKYLNDNVSARFVIATHSAAAIDSVDADIIQITREGSTSASRTISDNSGRYALVRNLGHSPSELIQTKFAIWVEGPSDRIYLNHWISRLAPQLIEGADYTILYYGGSVLAQHSFLDDESPEALDLVRGLSIARAFAVMIDSDRSIDRPNLRATKSRVREEVEKSGGMCWITDGREVENYIGEETLRQLALEFPYVSVTSEKRDQVLNPDKASKVAVANRAIQLDDGNWPLDLKRQVQELINRIEAAA